MPPDKSRLLTTCAGQRVTPSAVRERARAGEAFRWIQHGQAEVMVAGGAEATITAIGISESAPCRADRRNDAPHAATGVDRGATGSCAVKERARSCESLTRARRRGATILARIKGYAATATRSHHQASARREGRGTRHEARMKDARLAPRPSSTSMLTARRRPRATSGVESDRHGLRTHARDRKLW